MKWIALYSQTGSEIERLIRATGITPSAILSNSKSDKISPEIRSLTTFLTHNEIEETLPLLLDSDTIITLHGYLRIISPSICELTSNIFNGHPALLTHYPELKGKDMQEVAFYKKDQYPLAGSVVHRVIAELDAGEILTESCIHNDFTSVEDAYAKLRETSFDAWMQFFSSIEDYRK
jgi:folate-dependent phosphoribosylglycinamide formyltransferase PurN